MHLMDCQRCEITMACPVHAYMLHKVVHHCGCNDRPRHHIVTLPSDEEYEWDDGAPMLPPIKLQGNPDLLETIYETIATDTVVPTLQCMGVKVLKQHTRKGLTVVVLTAEDSLDVYMSPSERMDRHDLLEVRTTKERVATDVVKALVLFVKS